MCVCVCVRQCFQSFIYFLVLLLFYHSFIVFTFLFKYTSSLQFSAGFKLIYINENYNSHFIIKKMTIKSAEDPLSY